MKIKWLFFDIDNTLFDTKGLALKARKNALKAMIDAGLPAKDIDTAYTKLEKIIKKFGSNYGQHFNELVKEYKVPEKYRTKIITSGIVAYHNTKFEHIKPFEDVVPTLKKLSRKGYEFGVITNGLAVKQWEKLIRLGIQDFFKVVVISEEVGFEKPGKEIFEKALKLAFCKAEEVVMIGDKEEDMAASKVGIRTIGLKEVVEADYKIKKFGGILGVLEKI